MLLVSERTSRLPACINDLLPNLVEDCHNLLGNNFCLPKDGTHSHGDWWFSCSLAHWVNGSIMLMTIRCHFQDYNASLFASLLTRISSIVVRKSKGKGHVTCVAVNGTPSCSYWMSLDVWDHTVLPATKVNVPGLSPARQASTRSTYPRGMEGWVNLGDWLHTKMVYPPTDGHPSKY